MIEDVVCSFSDYPLNMSAPAVYNVSCNASEDSVNECQVTNLTDPSECSSNTSASVACSGNYGNNGDDE
mgnify:CR=1 FL=1